ncbi:MAG: hypothetical protein WD294_08145 [Phycisphaeraceae bacterium]
MVFRALFVGSLLLLVGCSSPGLVGHWKADPPPDQVASFELEVREDGTFFTRGDGANSNHGEWEEGGFDTLELRRERDGELLEADATFTLIDRDEARLSVPNESVEVRMIRGK